MLNYIDISGLDKASVLMALYNRARVQGLGFLQARDGDMSREEANALLANDDYFDYVHGRVLKISFAEDLLFTGLYNRDNGPNAAEKAIQDIAITI